MGDSITEGTIVDIPVAPGDYVNEDDVVLVLETDKVSVDVRAPEAGKIVEIMGEVDDVVEVGSGLYRLDTDAAKPDGGAGDASSKDASPSSEKTAPLPSPPAPAAAPVTPLPAPAAVPPHPPHPLATEKKAAPSQAPLPVMESVTTYLGNRPERRTKMSRMR